MKKLRYLLAFTLFLCMLAIGISAAETYSLPEKTKVKAGEEFSVTVKLDSAHPVLSMGATPDFSHDAFELVSGEWLCKNPLLSDFNKQTGDGVIMFKEVKEQGGEIFKFTLKVKDSAPAGSYNIKTSVIINYNTDEGAIHCIAKNSSVEVVADKATETTEIPATTATAEPETTREEPVDTTLETTEAPETAVSPETTGNEETKGGYIPQTAEGNPVEPPSQQLQPLDKQTVILIAVAVAGCVILGIVFGRASKRS